MSNIAVFDAGSVPAHVAKMFGGNTHTDDLKSGVSLGFPIISYKGKNWHVVQGSDRTLIANEDGDPRSSIEVVLIKSNPAISKVFYVDGYEEGSVARPDCYSHDGVTPASDVADKVSSQCAICPNNQWGSKITDNGSKGKACADSRRMAVAAAGDLENPMLLRVPAGSLKELVHYADMLAKRQAPYQALVTKISFDTDAAHPRFLFKTVRWLEQAELDMVAQVMQRSVIGDIVGNNLVADTAAYAPAETEIAGERPDTSAVETGARAALKAAAKPKSKPKVVEPEPVIEQAPEPEPAPKSTVKAGAFGGSAKAAAPQAAASSDDLLAMADSELDSILAELDDD